VGARGEVPEACGGADGLDRPLTLEDYNAAWRGLIPNRTTSPWPTLAGSTLLVGPAKNSADAAWAEGLDGMRDVRASRDVRSSFVRVRGADLLAWKREDYVTFGHAGQFQSGRAALGLPIRFQGTKGNYFLNPHGHNRYPSPLHLKVVELGSEFRPAILAIRGPAPRELTAANTRGTLDEKGLDRFLQLAGQLPGWTKS
jgi:hypothetical protein